MGSRKWYFGYIMSTQSLPAFVQRTNQLDQVLKGCILSFVNRQPRINTHKLHNLLAQRESIIRCGRLVSWLKFHRLLEPLSQLSSEPRTVVAYAPYFLIRGLDILVPKGYFKETFWYQVDGVMATHLVSWVFVHALKDQQLETEHTYLSRWSSRYCLFEC